MDKKNIINNTTQLKDLDKSKYVALLKHIRQLAKKMQNMGKQDVIYVFAHIDADGLASATIISYLLSILDKPFIMKFLPQIIPSNFESLLDEIDPQEVILLDLGTDLPNQILTSRNIQSIIVDHHSTESGISNNIINPIPWGIDGSTEISTSGLTYLLANSYKLEDNLESLLAFLAITGGLGDAQDIGPKRSLIGLNQIIVDYGKEKNWIEEAIDIFLLGRSIKPLYRLLAEYTLFEIPGISGSYESAHEFLVKNNILPEKTNIDQVFLDDLPPPKKQQMRKKLIEILLLRYTGQYTFSGLEEILSAKVYKYKANPLPIGYFARDLAILLNASGKMRNPQIALKALLTPKNKISFQRLINIYDRYKAFISEALKNIDKKVIERHNILVYDCRDLIEEELTSTLSSILIHKTALKKKVLLVIAKSFDGILKISIRAHQESKVPHLGQLITTITRRLKEASGGGHEKAAGAYIREEQLEIFLDQLEEELDKYA